MLQSVGATESGFDYNMYILLGMYFSIEENNINYGQRDVMR